MLILNGLDVNSKAFIIDYIIHKGCVVRYLVISYQL